MELILLICLASLFSTFTTPVLSAIFTLSMFLIGHISQSLLVFGRRSSSGTMRLCAGHPFYPLPHPAELHSEKEKGERGAAPLSALAYPAGYLLAYGAAVLFLACLLFSRKDFK